MNMRKQRLMGAGLLAISAAMAALAWMGSTPEERDITAAVLLAPLGVYQLNAPFQGGELEALGDAFDQVEGALEELNREACLATAEDWGLEQAASLFRRRPPATTVKTMREALAALLRIGGDSFTLAAINDTISGCGVHAHVEEKEIPGEVAVFFF